MAHTDNFRKQHEDLLAIVTSIAGQLDAESLTADASKVRGDLSSFIGKLTVHLSMEDKSLYPRMLNSDSLEAQQAAQKFQDEMGNLAGALKDFNNKWIVAESIQADASNFITDMNGIISVLGDRISREDSILYPIADAL